MQDAYRPGLGCQRIAIVSLFLYKIICLDAEQQEQPSLLSCARCLSLVSWSPTPFLCSLSWSGLGSSLGA